MSPKCPIYARTASAARLRYKTDTRMGGQKERLTLYRSNLSSSMIVIPFIRRTERKRGKLGEPTRAAVSNDEAYWVAMRVVFSHFGFAR